MAASYHGASQWFVWGSCPVRQKTALKLNSHHCARCLDHGRQRFPQSPLSANGPKNDFKKTVRKESKENNRTEANWKKINKLLHNPSWRSWEKNMKIHISSQPVTWELGCGPRGDCSEPHRFATSLNPSGASNLTTTNLTNCGPGGAELLGPCYGRSSCTILDVQAMRLKE